MHYGVNRQGRKRRLEHTPDDPPQLHSRTQHHRVNRTPATRPTETDGPPLTYAETTDRSIETDECWCSLIYRCKRCGPPERPKIDPPVDGGPAVPTPYTATNDVNPTCGCHLRSKCSACGGCTGCDACYCGED